MKIKSGSISVSLFKVIFFFLGCGIVLAGIYAILAAFAQTTEIRSQAGFIGEADRYLLNHPCNMAFKPPVTCAKGYNCLEMSVNGKIPPKVSSFARWGRCQPDVSPTPQPLPKITKCWNTVFEINGQFSWPNACRGSAAPDVACAEMITGLNAGEIDAYNAWVASGKPQIPGCGMSR
jgi:hypothetical protein